MNGKIASLLLFCAISLVAPLTASAVTIAWSPVGNPGNAPDPATGFGAVPYNYSIGTYDVTVGQYTDFLNAVAATDTYALYKTSMATDLNSAGIARTGVSGSYGYSVIGSANKPVTYVSWGDAARFANWLQNGQPTGVQGPGTTETGAYTLNGAITNAALTAVTRNAGATIVILSESEWYKAAYYNSAGSYNQYPFSSNTVPTSAVPGSTPNTENFYDSTTGYAITHSTNYSSSQNYLTSLGTYTASASPYGAFDMSGNVSQWTEAFRFPSARVLRGTSWNMYEYTLLSSWRDYYAESTGEGSDVGFRVAAVPEPSAFILAVFGLVGLAAWGWRRKRFCC
jgi:sulfatase modifying factor 1